jgi:hypothetical protein
LLHTILLQVYLNFATCLQPEPVYVNCHDVRRVIVRMCEISLFYFVSTEFRPLMFCIDDDGRLSHFHLL